MTDGAPVTAALAGQPFSAGDDVIRNALAFMRKHLEMDVAYLSEFIGEELVFRAVDAELSEQSVSEGQIVPLNQVYCRHIIAGRLPELMPDTNFVPFAQTIAITTQLPIRAHMSIPIKRGDGSIYGMFCCFSREARPSLNDRDLEVMRAFASLSADQVNLRMSRETSIKAKRQTITDILDTNAFDIALQPIMNLQFKGTAGFEALCRFSPQPYRAPNLWFDDAANVGLQAALELQVLGGALRLLADLPPTAYLAVNTSPSTLATGQISPLMAGLDGKRIMVEITEHAAIDDVDTVLMEIDRLRERGVRVAVDDAGAGYSGLQQIVRLRPDVIKLDMSLTQNIDKDLARRALASAMVQFAKDTNATVVAEGIETAAELRTLKDIGVQLGQGYFLGKPALSSEVLTLRRQA